MSELPLFIDTKSVFDDFDKHLNLADNNRILFSAPFGSGKSSFLEYYFKDRKDYTVIKLYPVNYSVASNYDIFELIKQDLIEQLLSKHGNLIDNTAATLNPLAIFKSFATNKLDYFRLVKLFIKASIPEGERIAEAFDEIKYIKDRFFEYEKQMTQTEAEVFNDYLDSFLQTKGSIYEFDAITQLINKFILNIKEQTEKQVILIIDDLDRLDPDHVFRLFNVFSAHYNNDYKINKFSLDKIIFVCDVFNIHKIFAYRFGQDVEFTGYIDKFYSTEVFHFNIKKLIHEKLTTLFNARTNDLQDSHFVYSSHFYSIFEFIILSLLDANVLKFRNLLKLRSFSTPQYFVSDLFRRKSRASNYEFLVIAHLLRHFFPTIETLLVAIGTLNSRYDESKINTVYYKNDLDADHISKLIASYSIPFIIDQNEMTSLFNQSARTVSSVSKFFYENKESTYQFEFYKQDNRALFKITQRVKNPFIYLYVALAAATSRGFIHESITSQY